MWGGSFIQDGEAGRLTGRATVFRQGEEPRDMGDGTEFDGQLGEAPDIILQPRDDEAPAPSISITSGGSAPTAPIGPVCHAVTPGHRHQVDLLIAISYRSALSLCTGRGHLSPIASITLGLSDI